MPKRSDNDGERASGGSLRSSCNGKRYSRLDLAKINLRLWSARSVLKAPLIVREIIVQPGRETGYQVSIQPPLSGRKPVQFDELSVANLHAIGLSIELAIPIKNVGKTA